MIRIAPPLSVRLSRHLYNRQRIEDNPDEINRCAVCVAVTNECSTGTCGYRGESSQNKGAANLAAPFVPKTELRYYFAITISPSSGLAGSAGGVPLDSTLAANSAWRGAAIGESPRLNFILRILLTPRSCIVTP